MGTENRLIIIIIGRNVIYVNKIIIVINEISITITFHDAYSGCRTDVDSSISIDLSLITTAIDISDGADGSINVTYHTILIIGDTFYCGTRSLSIAVSSRFTWSGIITFYVRLAYFKTFDIDIPEPEEETEPTGE